VVSLKHARRRRFSVYLLTGGLVLAMLLLALMSAGPVAGPDSAHAGVGKPTVCGGLEPDLAFEAEVPVIGRDHACEHLKGKSWGHAHRASAGTRASVDTADSSAVAAVSGTTPAEIGSWSPAVNPGTKTVGISAVLLHTGKVLLFGGKYRSTDKNTAAYLYDPMAGTGHEVPAPAAVFCGSVTQLSDGRVLSAGGADPVPKGIVDLWLFDPVTERWLRQPDSPLGRYYPTSTRLADGRILIAAGNQLDGRTKNPTVELYTPPAPGQTMGTLEVVGPSHVTNFYPTQWLMPDGNVLEVSGRNSAFLSPSSWSWTSLPLLPSPIGQGTAGLMLPSGSAGSNRVMVIGGNIKGVAQSRTFKYDYANRSTGWSLGTPMPTARAHMNVVQVPDGSAFGIGGNSSALYGQGQLQTMAYDPGTATWTNMASQTYRRAYHSTAILLPDGRIMSAGDTGAGGGRQRIDYYSPPYMFRPRPEIASAPAELAYGETFDITTSGPTSTQAVLMAPAATTHAVEMNARRVELAVTRTVNGLTATAPSSGRIAPPGHYMLFTMTSDGTPSTARWVHIEG
jgi:hypothetical protein